MLPFSMIFNFDVSKIADLIIINTVSQSGNLPQMFWRSDVHSKSHESSDSNFQAYFIPSIHVDLFLNSL